MSSAIATAATASTVMSTTAVSAAAMTSSSRASVSNHELWRVNTKLPTSLYHVCQENEFSGENQPTPSTIANYYEPFLRPGLLVPFSSPNTISDGKTDSSRKSKKVLLFVEFHFSCPLASSLNVNFSPIPHRATLYHGRRTSEGNVPSGGTEVFAFPYQGVVICGK